VAFAVLLPGAAYSQPAYHVLDGSPLWQPFWGLFGDFDLEYMEETTSFRSLALPYTSPYPDPRPYPDPAPDPTPNPTPNPTPTRTRTEPEPEPVPTRDGRWAPTHATPNPNPSP